MQWITVATPPFESIDKFDEVLAKAGGNPDGLEARYGGTAGGKLRVVSLWESKAHADRFFTETLPPLLTEVLGPEPSAQPRRSASTSPAATPASRSAERPAQSDQRSGLIISCRSGRAAIGTRSAPYGERSGRTFSQKSSS